MSVEPLGNDSIYMFPKIVIGHKRLCNFRLQSYGFFMIYANLFAKIKNL